MSIPILLSSDSMLDMDFSFTIPFTAMLYNKSDCRLKILKNFGDLIEIWGLLDYNAIN